VESEHLASGGTKTGISVLVPLALRSSKSCWIGVLGTRNI
jgi:hypothetical protein